MQMQSTFPVSEDRLLGGRLRLSQPVEGYRVAIDPVMLAAAVPAGPGQLVLDLGCGVGAAGLCLLERKPDLMVTGLEIQPELAALARANAAANQRQDAFRVVVGALEDGPLKPGFDHVMTNPPFDPPGRGTAPAGPIKAQANVEGRLDLAGWIKAACKLLVPGGRLTLIQRAERLDDILASLRGRGMGEVRVLPLWPKSGRPASRVIVTARKGSRARLELLPGLVLHREDGKYTEAAEAILRHGTHLMWRE